MLSKLNLRGGGSSRPLVKLELNQQVAGYDFGNVVNGDTSAEMDKLLASLPYELNEGVGSYYLVLGTGQNTESMAIGAFRYNNAYILICYDGQESFDNMRILYATKDFAMPPDFPPLSAKQGWNNLTDGLYRFANVPYQTNDSIDTADGWNGILIGAIVYK